MRSVFPAGGRVRDFGEKYKTFSLSNTEVGGGHGGIDKYIPEVMNNNTFWALNLNITVYNYGAGMGASGMLYVYVNGVQKYSTSWSRPLSSGTTKNTGFIICGPDFKVSDIRIKMTSTDFDSVKVAGTLYGYKK